MTHSVPLVSLLAPTLLTHTLPHPTTDPLQTERDIRRKSDSNTYIHTPTQTETYAGRDRHTDTYTDRDRHTDTYTEIDTETDTETDTDRDS